MEDKQADSEVTQEPSSGVENGQGEQIQNDHSWSQSSLTDLSVSLDLELQKIPPSDVGQQDSVDVAINIQQLMGEVQRLREDFETKVKYDESKERMIDTLHKELQSYREGLHFKILYPVFMDLINMYDDLERILENVATQESGISLAMLRNLQSFKDTIEEALNRYEVQAFSVEEDVLVSGKQRILKVIEVGNPAQDRHIARRVRKGFGYGDRVLRPEVVEIYRFNSDLQIREAEV